MYTVKSMISVTDNINRSWLVQHDAIILTLRNFQNTTLTKLIIDIIIPALNEEQSIAQVISALPEVFRYVLVCDNGSTDRTTEVAERAGATVLSEPRKGYGLACKMGLNFLAGLEVKPDIVVFLDADYSDFPEDLSAILQPMLSENIDFVVGNRLNPTRIKGSMTAPQRFGNWLATRLIKLFWGYNYTDLGPFRAIRYNKLLSLRMEDDNFGWTVEMQIKAAQKKLSYKEVAVRYRPRIGYSKVSGTVKGTILAGYKILWVIFKYGLIKR